MKICNGRRQDDYKLCNDCERHLEDGSNESKNARIEFLWCVFQDQIKIISVESAIFT